MPADVFTILERELREVSLEQHTVLHEPGARIDRVYFPQTGVVSLSILTRDGEMIETHMIGREGGVGLHRGFGKRRAFSRAVVQAPGRFATIDADRFEQLASDSVPIRNVISRYTEILLAESQRSVACNAVHDAARRLCRWLLQIADKAGTTEILLTQEYLAQMLGVRRTTVTLLAQSLQDRGIISYKRGKIRILNWDDLRANACECYEATQFERIATRLGIDL